MLMFGEFINTFFLLEQIANIKFFSLTFKFIDEPQ